MVVVVVLVVVLVVVDDVEVVEVVAVVEVVVDDVGAGTVDVVDASPEVVVTLVVEVVDGPVVVGAVDVDDPPSPVELQPASTSATATAITPRIRGTLAEPPGSASDLTAGGARGGSRPSDPRG